MRKLLQIALIASMGLMACSKKDVAPKIQKNQIRFTAQSSADLHISTFIDRQGQIIWQETTQSSAFDNTIEYELKTNDRVMVAATPADGKWHVIKTEIYIDGVLRKAQDKLCKGAGGCSVEIE
jgi:hypothetical protein